MIFSMAKVIAIGEPVNDAERKVIAHLRDNLPDSFVLMHNFELQVAKQTFEIDREHYQFVNKNVA